MDLELEKLYLLYQAGAKTVGRDTSPLLQVAQSVGPGLTMDEFSEIHRNVQLLETNIDRKKNTAAFQEALWQFPEEWKKRGSVDFSPSRTNDNEPVQHESSDPTALQAFLQSKSYDDVKHNTLLRNAWHAAQQGVLTDLAATGNLWTITDDKSSLAIGLGTIKDKSERMTYGEGVQSLFDNQSHFDFADSLESERGRIALRLPMSGFGIEDSPDSLGTRLSRNTDYSFIHESVRDAEFNGVNLTNLAGMTDRYQKRESAYKWAQGYFDKYHEDLSREIIQDRLKGIVTDQLPYREHDLPNLQRLYEGAMDAGFSYDPRIVEQPSPSVMPMPESDPPPSTPSDIPATPAAPTPSVIPIAPVSPVPIEPVPAVEPSPEIAPTPTFAPSPQPSTPAPLPTTEPDKKRAWWNPWGIWDWFKPRKDRSSAKDGKLSSAKAISDQSRVADKPIKSPVDPQDLESVPPSKTSLPEMREGILDSAFEPGGENDPSAGGLESRLPGNDSESGGGSWLDTLQMVLDGVGAVEPTPFADLANAGISMARVLTDPENATRHLMNAGISLIGTIPYLGDIAKLAKGYGKTGKTIGGALEGFASSKGAGMLKSIGGFLGGGAGGAGNHGAGDNGSGDGDGGSSASPSPGGGGGGSAPGGSMVGAFGQTLLPALTIAVGASIAGFRMLNKWLEQTVETGRQMVEQNRALAQYSGELSAAMMQYDSRGVLRKIRESEYLGASAAALANSQADVEDAKSHYNAPFQRVWNNIQTTLNQIATVGYTIASYVEPISSTLNGFFGTYDTVKEIIAGDDKSKEPRNAFEHLLNQNDQLNANRNQGVKLPAQQAAGLKKP